jgi:hypothetical protein
MEVNIMDGNLIGRIGGPDKLIEYKPLVKKDPVAGSEGSGTQVKDGLSGSVPKEEVKDPRQLFSRQGDLPIPHVNKEGKIALGDPTKDDMPSSKFKDGPMADAMKGQVIFMDNPTAFFISGNLNSPLNLGDGIVSLKGLKISNNPTTLQME